MSKPSNRRASGRPDKAERKQQQQEQERRLQEARAGAQRRARRNVLLVRGGGAVLAVLAIAAAVLYSLRGSGNAAGVAVAADLGRPTSDVAAPVTGQFTPAGKPLYLHGKPEVVLVSAQYCPHCAAQRWPIIKALNQFGTFSGLSSSTNGDGTVPTFDLVNAQYRSKYVAFVHTDIEDRQHNSLQTLDGQEQALVNKYDSSGGIPFILIGGYALIGDGYNLAEIQGQHFSAIQNGLVRDLNQPYVADINAEANTITALICHADGNKPQAACGRSVIRKITAGLH